MSQTIRDLIFEQSTLGSETLCFQDDLLMLLGQLGEIAGCVPGHRSWKRSGDRGGHQHSGDGFGEDPLAELVRGSLAIEVVSAMKHHVQVWDTGQSPSGWRGHSAAIATAAIQIPSPRVKGLWVWLPTLDAQLTYSRSQRGSSISDSLGACPPVVEEELFVGSNYGRNRASCIGITGSAGFIQPAEITRVEAETFADVLGADLPHT